MTDDQLAKPIPERWLDLHDEAVTDLTKWPTERAPENLFYQVKQLVEELGSAESKVRELELEIKSGDEMYEAQQEKYEGCPHKPISGEANECGCSFDNIGDVCGLHSPALRKSQERVRELEQALREITSLEMGNFVVPQSTIDRALAAPHVTDKAAKS